MRKNKMMRAASGLLVAVLLTTCIISGTFAKYTSSATGNDTARVARWGFNDTTSILLTDLFKTAYDKNVNGEADVIAPGTTNSADFAFKYSGGQNAPEVAYTLKIDTTGSKCSEDIKKNTNIVWYLDNEACTATENKTSWDVLLEKINALDGDEEYEAGELPDAFNKTSNHTVKWEWKFDKDQEGATDLDTKDTEMGNKSDLDSVTLKISITAEQVD